MSRRALKLADTSTPVPVLLFPLKHTEGPVVFSSELKLSTQAVNRGLSMLFSGCIWSQPYSLSCQAALLEWGKKLWWKWAEIWDMWGRWRSTLPSVLWLFSEFCFCLFSLQILLYISLPSHFLIFFFFFEQRRHNIDFSGALLNRQGPAASCKKTQPMWILLNVSGSGTKGKKPTGCLPLLLHRGLFAKMFLFSLWSYLLVKYLACLATTVQMNNSANKEMQRMLTSRDDDLGPSSSFCSQLRRRDRKTDPRTP